MAVTKNQLKLWFQTALKPTQAQFAAWIDAMRHVDDKIAQSDLSTSLSDKIDSLPSTDVLNAAIANKVSKWQHWEGLFVAKDATTGKMIFKADPANGLAQLGDFGNVANSTFISVDDANGVIIANAANGFRGAGSVWQLDANGDAKFANATISSLTSTVLKVNSAGKLVAAVADVDYQTPIGYTPVNKAGDTMLGHLTLVGDAVNALHPITKSQFDNLQTGLSWKYSARASTVAALPSYTVSGDFLTLTATANGALALDGVTLVVGDRILVKNEAGAARVNNGAYTVTQVGSVSQPYILTRTTAANTSDGLTAATFYVREGTIEANRIYAVNTNPVVLGTTQITFALVAGAGTYANGTGLDLTGNVFSIANAGVSNAMLAGGIADAKISSAANWNTAFNNRISNFTTTGNSGAATFVGNVLNVPNYTLAGLGGLPLTGGTITNPVTVNAPNFYQPTLVVQGDYRLAAPVATVLPITQAGLTAGTYNNVATTTTFGGGSGLTLNIVVTGTNVSATVVNAGSGYMVTDKVTVLQSAIGGTSGTVTFSIASVTSTNNISYNNSGFVANNHAVNLSFGTSAWNPAFSFGITDRSNNALLYGGASFGWETTANSADFALRLNNGTVFSISGSAFRIRNGLRVDLTSQFIGAATFSNTTTFSNSVLLNSSLSTGIDFAGLNAQRGLTISHVSLNSHVGFRSAVNIPRGNVLNYTITNGGSGYTNGTYAVIITGGSGTGAAATVTVVGGVVTACVASLTLNAINYIQGETVSFTGTGTGFTATVNLRNETMSMFSALDSFNSSGADIYRAYNATPTINQTSGATGDVNGFFWNPTLTALLGRNIAFENVSGDVLLNTNSGSTVLGSRTAVASSILTMASTTRGFLPPRMTKSQRDAIATPATGLVIFQTDNTPGLRCYNGTNWMRYTETTD